MSHRNGLDPAFCREAEVLGRMIGERGYSLRYGAGGDGLMGTVARAALTAGARVVGVTTPTLREREPPVEGIHHLHVVNTLDEREALLRLGDGFIVLPGSHGTLGEFVRTLMERKLGVHTKPIVLLNVARFWDPFLAFCHSARLHGIMGSEGLEAVPVVDSPDEALTAIERAWAASGQAASSPDFSASERHRALGIAA
ncbi:MAG TPA: TIGR00730 family Rossman fold protein [Solirubrobacteraceae bacterium]|nr:TIGR00730 family Rossman fold protein [Solirubrobacteraceae bacterium]